MGTSTSPAPPAEPATLSERGARWKRIGGRRPHDPARYRVDEGRLPRAGRIRPAAPRLLLLGTRVHNAGLGTEPQPVGRTADGDSGSEPRALRAVVRRGLVRVP